MAKDHTVCQEGQVIKINGNNVQVKIVASSACAQCHAKGMCTSLDMKEKIITAISISPTALEIGDSVYVVMEERLGWIAIFYGFFLPLLVMMMVFFIFIQMKFNDTMAALFSITSLIPYYLLLFVFRKKIEKDFIFKVKKK